MLECIGSITLLWLHFVLIGALNDELYAQDATKFCLADAGRKRFSQSINIKTVGAALLPIYHV